jgi:hypothetical protein
VLEKDVRRENAIVGFENAIVGFENAIVGFENAIVGFENAIVGFNDIMAISFFIPIFTTCCQVSARY